MKQRVLIFKIIIIQLLFVAVLHAEEKISVAFYDSGNPTGESFAMLLEAQLSRENNLTILDRKYITQLLAEQKLGLTGYIKGDDSVKIGKLLHCDLFVYINELPQMDLAKTQTVNLVVFDTHYGIRLCDISLPITNDMETSVPVAIAWIKKALKKWNGTKSSNLKMISFLSIRNLNLPPSLNKLPQAITKIIEAQLVNDSSIILLERQHLNFLLKESNLTGKRYRDILPSAVSLDLEVQQSQHSIIEIKVILSNQHGNIISQITSTGAINQLDSACLSLVKQLSKTLNISPDIHHKQAVFTESEKFLTDFKRLRIRALNTDAEIAITAAQVLAEAAISKDTGNVLYQKLLIIILLEQYNNRNDILAKLNLLEEMFSFAGKWARPEDCRWFLRHITENFHHDTVSILNTPNTPLSRQFIALRQAYRNIFEKSLINSDQPLLFKSLELVAQNPKELFQLCNKYMHSLPNGLGMKRFTYFTGYNSDDLYFIFDFQNLKREECLQLLKLYETWSGSEINNNQEATDLARMQRMQSLLCAAMLVNCFNIQHHPVESFLSQLDQLLLKNPALTQSCLDFICKRGEKIPAFYKPLSPDLVCNVFRQLTQALNQRKVATPLLFIYLDQYDGSHSGYPGAYLQMAWQQLHNQDFTQPKGDWLTPRFREWYVNLLEKVYEMRYGLDISDLKQELIPTLSPQQLQCIYEFPGVQGVSSIESAEINGDYLYLLICHQAPRTYEIVQLDLKTKNRESLGTIQTEHSFKPYTGSEIHIGQNYISVPTDDGIICFHKTQPGPPFVINQTNGLPVTETTACVSVDNQLFIGCKGTFESYFIKYDILQKKSEIIACSGRKQRDSGMDDCPPYVISSMVYLPTQNKIYLDCIFLEKNPGTHPWLWTYDLGNRTLESTFPFPYFPIHLRLLNDDSLLIQTANMNYHHSVVYPTNGRLEKVNLQLPAPAAAGYAIWDGKSVAATYDKTLKAVIGDIDPEKYQIFYGYPNFSGKGHIIPGSTSNMALIDKYYLISSSTPRSPVAYPTNTSPYMISNEPGYEKDWQLIPPQNMKHQLTKLPRLADQAPFMIRNYGDQIIACTPYGVWQLTLPDSAIKQNVDATRSEKESYAKPPLQKVSGRLIVKAPNGTSVTIKNGKTYKIWWNNQLSWNQLTPGFYTISLEFLSDKVKKTIEVKPNQTAELTESFGINKQKTMRIKLNKACEIEMVWIDPPSRHDSVKYRQNAVHHGFWISKTEVTQKQYIAVTQSNPSSYIGMDIPVHNISLQQANQFCKQLNQLKPFPNMIFRIPSDAEWYIATKGCSNDKSYAGNSMDAYLCCGWFPENSDGHPHQIGLKMPNKHGLYDTLGNVAEWNEMGFQYGNSCTNSSTMNGIRLVLAEPDNIRQLDKESWTSLVYLKPELVRVGYRHLITFKKRDLKPYFGNTYFSTEIYAHANSIIKYKLAKKYKRFKAYYAMGHNAGGTGRFAVFCDGKQRFMSQPIRGHGGSVLIGVNTPIELNIEGVDILELKTLGDTNGSIAASHTMWGDPKVK